ncbi:MAG: MFS transporter [Pseudobdellovibrionaceae bacterium]
MNQNLNQSLKSSVLWISALGYFVDMYDLLLFSIVRVQSLASLGIAESEMLSSGVMLINLQMAGLLLGGFFWGYLGDKKGRASVLMASILTYSLANFLNAFVQDVNQYAILRFIAGFGLAGELGIAVTLVSETLSREKRGYGAAIIAGIGMAGTVTACVAAEFLSWRVCYAVGGIMGFLLLIGRMSLRESPLFLSMHKQSSWADGMKALFLRPKNLFKYLRCVIIGLPLWFTSGILITFAPEFGKALNISDPLSAGKGVLYCYAAACFGDLLAGLLSQKLKSRKKAIGIFMFGTLVSSILFLTAQNWSAQGVYWICAFMGLSGGYWALFVLVASEQFGTNIRATVTTSAPNVVRGFVVIMTSAFRFLTPQFGVIKGAAIVGTIVLAIAYISLFMMEESFSKDLDYLET